jgi:hypothetical protein
MPSGIGPLNLLLSSVSHSNDVKLQFLRYDHGTTLDTDSTYGGHWLQMMRSHRRWQRVADSIQIDGFLPRIFLGVEYHSNYSYILHNEGDPLKDSVDVLGFGHIATKKTRNKHYIKLAARLHPDSVSANFPWIEDALREDASTFLKEERENFLKKIENSSKCVNSAQDEMSNMSDKEFVKIRKVKDEEIEDLDFKSFEMTQGYDFKLTNAKQHRAIATDMVNAIIQEHIVETPDGEMFEWTYKRGVRYLCPDYTKPICTFMDGKELRNKEAFGLFLKERVVDLTKNYDDPTIDKNNFFAVYAPDWQRHLESPEGRAFFREMKVQFSVIPAKALFPDLRSNNGGRKFNREFVAFSNAYFNVDTLTFMTKAEFESSGCIAAINHIDHEVPANILRDPSILKSHVFFHSVKHTIPVYLSLFEKDSHAQVQLALLGALYFPRSESYHRYEISSHVVGSASCGKSEEQDCTRILMNKENCHVASYQQISSSNSFADSQLQQQSVGKELMLIDELPDHGSISASSYKNWVSQKSSVNANVKNQQRLTKGTISMGVMYSGNKTLEFSKDGVGPNKSWPDMGCLRRILIRNKLLDPKPYEYMKNVIPSEVIEEKEVL